MDGLEVCLLKSESHEVLIEESFDLTRGVHADIVVGIKRNKCKRLQIVNTSSSESMFDGFDGLPVVNHSAKESRLKRSTYLILISDLLIALHWAAPVREDSWGINHFGGTRASIWYCSGPSRSKKRWS